MLYCHKDTDFLFQEKILIVPEGFVFHENLYTTIEQLLSELIDCCKNMEYIKYLVKNSEMFDCENKQDLISTWQEKVEVYERSQRKNRPDRYRVGLPEEQNMENDPIYDSEAGRRKGSY